MRIAVLGLGGVGTAAARFLAAAGHTVVGFEQFKLDHDRGSSFGASRIIRRVYSKPLYVALMDAAYPLWDALEAEAGEELFVRCGGFFFGPEDHPEMADIEAALQQIGIPYERWSAAEASRRVSPLKLGAHEYGVFEAQCGFLRASRCVLANARGARAAGAELREECPVEALEPAAEGVRVRCGGRWEVFDRVVCTGGPWTAPLLSPWVRLNLTVTRQQYAHFTILEGRPAFSPNSFPVWIDHGTNYYGFPEIEEIPGAKVALDGWGTPFDPNQAGREPTEADNESIRTYLRSRMPAATGPATYSKVCLYTMTPTRDFVIDRIPQELRISFIAGLSGHGFKFTVLLGQIAAQLAQDLDPGFDLSALSLARHQASGGS